MDSQHDTINKKHNKDSLLTGVIIAALFWAIYTLYIDDFIATDLRLISSIISEKILKLVGIGVLRNGTVLYNENMSFEVIGACSGSTTLKVMLGAGILLSLSWRGLTKVSRFTAILLSGILAVIFNGLRVTVLVLAGIALKAPVGEGFLHNLIGLITFAICFCTFCFICLLLAKRNKLNNNNSNEKTISIIRTISIIIVLTLLYLPFIKDLIKSWVGSNWDSSNQIGFIFFIIPAALIIYQSLQYSKNCKTTVYNKFKNNLVITFIITALVIGILSRTIDLNIIGGLGVILLCISLTINYNNILITFVHLPLLIAPILGFPRILLRIKNFIPETSLLTPEIIRITIFIFLIAIHLLLNYYFSRKKNLIQSSTPKTIYKNKLKAYQPFQIKKLLLYCSILALTIAILLPTSNNKANTPTLTTEDINLPYYLNNWIGKDLRISKNDINYFGKENIIFRTYNKTSPQSTSSVNLLITLSAGNRHKNHPPEFCQSGSGWEVISTTTMKKPLNNPRSFTLLSLKKDNNIKYMLYFFSSETSEESNYSKMMFNDITSRLSGSISNWAVIRLFSKSKSELMEFANKLPYPLFKTNK